MEYFSRVAYGTHEVWARVAWAMVELGREVDASPAALLAGLPFDEHTMLRQRRVAWADYCTIVERLTEAAGGLAEVEDLAVGRYHSVLPEIRAMLGAVVDPRLLYRFVIDVIDPIAFPPAAFIYEDLGDDRIHVGIHLRPGARPCEAWFAGNTGALRGLTAHMGLPPAELISCDVGAAHGTWEVRLPPSRTITRRVRSLVMRIVLGAEPDGTPIATTIATPGLDPIGAQLEHAIATWKLTPRQAEVLALVAIGKANKEIASALACADNTVELHVTRLLRKAALTSRAQLIAQFWAGTWGFPP